jgi:CRP/FNR family cyclic AMP-dependent transcriptional regulator
MPETSTPTLPTFSWIGHLKEDDRELLSSYGQFFPGHPGNVIIAEGHMQDEVFVVISGELEVHVEQEDGTRVLLARVGPGQTIGEMSLFDPAPATATVTASEFSQLWRIADEDLIRFMEEDPGAGNVLLRTLATILAQRLRQVDPKAFGLSAYAVVDSPELEAQDAAAPLPEVASILEEPPIPVSELTPITLSPVTQDVVVPIVAPAPAIPPVVPVTSAPIITAPATGAEPTPLTDVPSAVSGRIAPITLDPNSPTPPAPAAVVPQALPVAGEKTILKKTQPIVDPDELEPL